MQSSTSCKQEHMVSRGTEDLLQGLKGRCSLLDLREVGWAKKQRAGCQVPEIVKVITVHQEVRTIVDVHHITEPVAICWDKEEQGTRGSKGLLPGALNLRNCCRSAWEQSWWGPKIRKDFSSGVRGPKHTHQLSQTNGLTNFKLLK